jgi:putative ABC transport system permease protein
MQTFLQDLRYGARMLARKPGFTLIAVLTLALGIGANTAIFSVVNTLLLRPLPYTSGERLVMVWQTNPKIEFFANEIPPTVADYYDWQEQNQVFDGLTLFGSGSKNLTGSGEPVKIGAANVTANFFELMGVHPELGSGFSANDDQPAGEKIVAISHNLWQSRFGGTAIIGETIVLDQESYRVVGVMPTGFNFPRAAEMPKHVGAFKQTDLWIPTRFTAQQKTDRANHFNTVIARLKSGVTLEQAQTEMSTIAANLEKQYADNNEGFGVKLVPFREQFVGNIRLALLVLMGAVGFVLLIACANVANLLFARSSARQKEIAVRAALGAGRGRIIRQLLTESLLLAALGGLLGILVTPWVISLLVALAPQNIPLLGEIKTDGSVLIFTFATSLFTSVIFGLAPAFQTSRLNLTEALKADSKAAVGNAHRNRARNAMVIAEIALSLVLLVGAGLAIKSFIRLINVDAGFKPTQVITFNPAPSFTKYKNDPQPTAFTQRVLEQVRAIPGVEAAGAVSDLPLSGSENMGGFSVEGKPEDAANKSKMIDRRGVTSGYFEAIGIPLISGRYFNEFDKTGSSGVIIVSESFARRYLPGEDPLGKRVKLGSASSDRPYLTIVGVVGDVKHTTLVDEARPHLYYPYLQRPQLTMGFVVRSPLNLGTLAPLIREAVWSVDRDAPVENLKPLEQSIIEATAQKRFQMLLLTLFAGLALLLASVGIYGVMSYAVSQRTQELGIRLALGARPGDLMRMILKDGLLVTAGGVAIGIISALALTRVMQALLFEVSATDPLIFILVAVILTGVALVACLAPARRATKVDPMVALRYE